MKQQSGADELSVVVEVLTELAFLVAVEESARLMLFIRVDSPDGLVMFLRGYSAEVALKL